MGNRPNPGDARIVGRAPAPRERETAMNATSESQILERLTEASAAPPPPRTIAAARARRPESASQLLASWLRSQSISVTRHAAALRPFSRAEFGNDAASPTES